MKHDFSRQVLAAVAKVPKGKLITYSQVAKRAGSPKAYRAVGNVLNRNYRDGVSQLPFKEFMPVPCHRVICSNGAIGGYANGQDAKAKLLREEGHIIDKGKIRLPNLV